MSATQADGAVSVQASSTANKETVTQSKKSCGWVRRNWVHVSLLGFAAAAVIMAILLSLDACSTDTTTYLTNVTVVTETTVETMSVTPLAMVTLIDGSGSMKCCPGIAFSNTCMNSCQPIDTESDETTYWLGGRAGIPVLHNALSSAMNAAVTETTTSFNTTKTNRTNAENGEMTATVTTGDAVVSKTNLTFSNKLSVGIVQWSDISVEVSGSSAGYGLVVGAEVQVGVGAANAYIEGPDTEEPQTGGTFWGNPLCKCYSMLKANNTIWLGHSKMCVLMTDGVNGDTVSSYDYASQGAEECAGDFIEDWDAAGKPKWGGATPDDRLTVEDIGAFLQAQDITVFGINTNDGAQDNLYRISSCNQDRNYTVPCDNYLYFNDFSQLEEYATAIGSRLRNAAVSSGSSSSSSSASSGDTIDENVSLCSLDFLWALLAFLPLLLYFIYRCIAIKAEARNLSNTLYADLRSGKITRVNKCGFATHATNALLPDQYVGDIDHSISFTMFYLCPCLLPFSENEAQKKLDEQNTLHL